MRSAVVLGGGAADEELAGLRPVTTGPRREFLEIAKAVDGDGISYAAGCRQFGRPFAKLFASKPKLGSVAYAALAASRYDRLYTEGEGIGLPLAVALRARGWKGKIVSVFHNMSSRTKQRLLRIAGHDMFAAIIVVAGQQKDILLRECGLPADKVHSIFNWVDDKFFTPASAKPPENHVFMACGAENRDYGTLVEAARRVDVQFEVYGHGWMTDNVRVENVELNNLTWRPKVPYEGLRDAYAACTGVVVPLNDTCYGAGVTGIVEAMACGKPVIVSASHGIKNYLAAIDPEYVVPVGDAAALAGAITLLAGDEARRRKVGQQNRRLAETMASMDGYVSLVKRLMLQ
jgi:glycosyltransferase involved in cell wall biosynthesis